MQDADATEGITDGHALSVDAAAGCVDDAGIAVFDAACAPRIGVVALAGIADALTDRADTSDTTEITVINLSVAVVVFVVADLGLGCDLTEAMSPLTYTTNLRSHSANPNPCRSECPSVTSAAQTFVNLSVAVVVFAVADLCAWKDLTDTRTPLTGVTGLCSLPANACVCRACWAVVTASLETVVDLPIAIVVESIADLDAW